MTLAADVIWCLHVLFIAWMVTAPFSSDPDWVLAHAAVCPFLFAHWGLGDDTCALTLLESRLRGVEVQSSFIHRIVSPIYVITDDGARQSAVVITLGLWAVSLTRVARMQRSGSLPWQSPSRVK